MKRLSHLPTFAFTAAATLVLACTSAYAEDAPGTPIASPVPAPEQHPTGPALSVGGHFGMALPIATISNNSTVIGKDFAQIGLTPGVTVHLDEHWAVDFEFIAINDFKPTHAYTTFVVDPGVVRSFDHFAAGVRLATKVGSGQLSNFGVVPIVVVPFKITDKFSYFIEGDLPLFISDDGSKAEPSVTFQLQTGIGF